MIRCGIVFALAATCVIAGHVLADDGSDRSTAASDSRIEGDLNGETPNLRIVLHLGSSEDVDEVWVAFDEVTASHVELGWITVSQNARQVDLLAVQDGMVEEIGLDTVAAGDYEQVRLHLTDSWVVVDGQRHDLDMPSGYISGLKIGHDFTVPECGQLTLDLDWDVGAHLIHNRAQGYVLRPVVEVTSEITEGDVVSTKGLVDLNGDGAGDLVASGKPARFSFTKDAYAHLNDGTSIPDAPDSSAAAPSFAGFASTGWNPGDLTGDGLGDVLIGAEKAGAVYLYGGTSSGIASSPSRTFTSPLGLTGCSSFAGAGYCYGATVRTGDVNGDGFDDLIVGAKEYLYVYSGNSTGFSSTVSQTIQDPLFSFSSSDGFGFALAVGDFDGDGIDDVAAGAERAGGGFNGLAYVYSGSTTGLAAFPTTIAPPSAECPFFCGFGTAVTADDFDGDGIDDLAVGAPRAVFRSGSVFIYGGSTSGIATTPGTTVTGSSEMGSKLAAVGDFDGNGYNDLAASGNSTTVSVLGGSATGVTGAVSEVQGPGPYSLFGDLTLQSIVGVGDVNGDGFDDLAVSQEMYDGDGDFVREGALWIYYGSTNASSSTPDDEVTGGSSTFEYSAIDGLGYNPDVGSDTVVICD